MMSSSGWVTTNFFKISESNDKKLSLDFLKETVSAKELLGPGNILIVCSRHVETVLLISNFNDSRAKNICLGK